MDPNRRARLAAPGIVPLALLGVWLGHTIEYARVWGLQGLQGELGGSIHGYMVPFAAILAIAAALLGLRLWATWLSLGRRLDRARAAIFGLWRGRRVEVTVNPTRPPSAPAGLIALWLPLATIQIGFYLLQENVEAQVARAPAPGWTAVTGVHWAAPLVQAGVALFLAAAVLLVGRLFRRRSAPVERVEALLRALVHTRLPAAGAKPQPASTTRSPLDSLGSHLWRRPPPSPLFA